MSLVGLRPAHAVVAMIILFAAAQPTAATDPASDPRPDPLVDPQPMPPSVHAEMLAEHAGDVLTVPAGGPTEPRAASRPEGGTTTSATGGLTALPSGLTHEVLGYLPHWMLSSAHLGALDYELLSTIAYFSVGARPDGTLEKTVDGVPTAGWAGWNSSAMTDVINAAHQRGAAVVLTVTMMAWDRDYRDFTTLLTSSTNRSRLATQIARAVKSRNADGVNLDFEPMPNSLESHYTRFVRKVKSELVRQGAGSYLTVATTGGAASWDEGYELTDNPDGNDVHLLSAGSADALMVMAYDFNWSGSARAGGVAPMDSAYTLDARRAMEAYLRVVPASKIIWGVPYYGRAWTTTTSRVNSQTCLSAGTCRAASWAPTYLTARDAVATHGRRWDDGGQVPWYRYESSTYGTWVQGYYDDSQSLSVKYDFVKASRVRGVGIWHLLMDGSRRDLWNTIAVEFGPPPFTDSSGSKFAAAIAWVYQAGIMDGCTETEFCPKGYLTRGALASALANGLNLPPTSTDYYADDDGSRYEDDINRLAAAGLTRGCGNGDYCPGQAVRRGQLATALAWALGLPSTSTDYFSDDDGDRHEANINRIAAAGISGGCGDGRYCPDYRVRRAQAAAFLRNAFD